MATRGGKKRASEHAHWAFTIHVNNKEEWKPPQNILQLQYLIAQTERGGNTDRLHYQGYVWFKRSCTMGAVKKRLDCNHAHLEPW